MFIRSQRSLITFSKRMLNIFRSRGIYFTKHEGVYRAWSNPLMSLVIVILNLNSHTVLHRQITELHKLLVLTTTVQKSFIFSLYKYGLFSWYAYYIMYTSWKIHTCFITYCIAGYFSI